jgi:aerobic-type carbon monoxide dehydrogenase small subunit (CoxS/CutS family)
MKEKLKIKLNGNPVSLEAEGDMRLLWLIRTDLGLTGTKCGCEEGYCGACTVLINGKAVRSCQVSVREIQGKELMTIEGLARQGNLHPLQKAFVNHGALQCGFCTPGMILSAYALLLENSEPKQEEIIKAMDGNLCRCGAHPRILLAIQKAGQEMRRTKR